MDSEYILSQLKIEEPVIAIYPYGSWNYNTARQDSDHDFIIVGKGATLSNGAFKNNAISSADRKIQGVMYSRGGFIDAINNYDISALECLSVEPILRKWPFKIQKWNEKEMAKKIIQKISSSWHVADQQAKDGFRDRAKKGIFHAIRILKFALQLKEHREIVNFDCEHLWLEFRFIPTPQFDTRDWIPLRDELMEELRS